MKTEHAQEPVFLLDGARFKLSFNEVCCDECGAESDRVTVEPLGMYTNDLQGRWVALVPAEDDKHLDLLHIKKQRDELLAALESNQSRGVRDVIVERRRQINIEGWSSHHDDQHSYGEMALAAGCYAMFGLCFNAGDPPKYWPWDKKWWKPSDKRRNLVKAAALIIAEIERIDRAAIASVKEKQNAD